MLPGIRFYLICIFLCVPFLTKAQFTTADSLFKLGLYYDAGIAYERVIFNNPTPEVKQEALLRKSYTYKLRHYFTEALQTLERTDLTDQPDSVQFTFRYEMALNAYLAQHYAAAQNQLLQLKYFIPDTALTNQTLYLEILTLHALNRPTEADSVFKIYAQVYKLPVQTIAAYHQIEKPQLKNPKKAERLAMFLPGVGQMYAGYPVRGLTSAGLQTAALTFGVFSMVNGNYLLGFFSGFGLLQAFYFGSLRHTQYLVEKKNAELTQAYQEKLKQVILQQETENRLKK